ncbi:hypothetical protein SAMN04488020_102211 [Palleronia marisminoris]|uniref:Uncharacterized protein n=2 Tax=Palleronia marisminoris TaxID=315423 RepID=A0A1Y5RX27_9RHOB|nr:hypothetical protein SAMN04488020_102211 [Palleronia marisminoris]SLN27307.1 hypothetical protein PAM7066_01070 [Palleronia marisminoris]
MSDEPGPLAQCLATTHIPRMNYVLALFLPPLSIFLTGRLFLSILVFLIWVPAIIFSGGLSHPMFIALAWILIYQDRADRRGG